MKIKSSKPVLILFSLLLMALLLQGCVKKNTGEPAVTENETLTVGNFFPMKENVHYIYEGLGNEYAAYDIWVDYTADGKVQHRVSNGGTVMSKVYEIKEGALTKTFSREEVYYRENFLDTSSGEPEVMLMEPIKVGTRWTLADGRIRSIMATDAQVTVPLGTYSALQIITEDPKNTSNTTYDFYVKDMGLVKTVFLMGENEISSSLKEIAKDVALPQTVQFYYPDIDTETYTVIAKELNFNTNDNTGQVLAKSYKQAPGGTLGAVLSENTKVNTLTLNQEGKILIDLSSAFRTEMNAGSGYESMILQSVANTFGAYYNNAKEVILTVDGKPYSSGHYEFQEGESIPTKYNSPE